MMNDLEAFDLGVRLVDGVFPTAKRSHMAFAYKSGWEACNIRLREERAKLNRLYSHIAALEKKLADCDKRC